MAANSDRRPGGLRSSGRCTCQAACAPRRAGSRARAVRVRVAVSCSPWGRGSSLGRRAVRHLIDYLRRAGMPTTVTKVTREHIESFLPDLQGKVKPSSVAVRYRSLT